MKAKVKRAHGHILSVETLTRGSALAADAAAGATSITVIDAGDFDEDGGWLTIGGQVIEFTGCDDDAGTIALADPLSSAAEEGDTVAAWSELYEETIEYQEALVQLEGDRDNPEGVTAEVAEGVGELPEGDRGRAGESCTLHRVGEDEWEVVAVGGRSRRSDGLRAEADDYYTLTAADITAGRATIPLTHRPADEWLIAVLAGVPQRPTNYSINYDAQSITWPLDGWEKTGDVIWVHYAYRKGVKTKALVYEITDDFQRDELGGATRSDTGGTIPWETSHGTWAIASGSLYCTGVDDGGMRHTSICAIDTGQADGELSVTIKGTDASNSRAFAFRVASDLLSGWTFQTNGVIVFDGDYSSSASVSTFNTGVTLAEGDHVRVRLEGDAITVFVNDVEVYQITDARNGSATHSGFAAATAQSPTNAFDNYAYTAGL